ncbi:MAG TPA: phenylalanine--tRNA ligase subunit beta [Cyclobacteriaceae bacterium]|nr:phenylalanine--tRNA ligase subunit beta [Cyclobacteriaceae bacterium]
MTISYDWLKEYIDIPESPEQLGDMLTGTGLEVESIETFETVRGGLRGLVIGEVLTCVKHPNADKLSLTTVDVGDGSARQIVCGAPNVAAGQKVLVALPGVTLYPADGEPFEIRKTKIRGESSEGMICAEDEVGLGTNHDGIMVLDPTAKPGTPAAEYFNVTTDYQIEIGLTPNRADAMSHVGVARDVRAVTGRALKVPDVSAFRAHDQSLVIPVEVENVAACPRYSALTISGVVVSESPEWLKQRLQSIGLTPINNIVDITNFVCHELGQPLHAFDADAITGGKVVVKTLPAGSTFTTLDGRERTLLESDLMICNAKEGMCIAGVFGGLKSGVKPETRTIFLESACFSPDYIRKTVQHHQLRTDASFRFERGTDPEGTVPALKRAALMIAEIAGGRVTSDIIDIYPQPVPHRRILVRDRNVNRLIGKVIPRDEIAQILERLDIAITEKSDDQYTVSVPPYRVDVTQEADVVEEILRIYGFNNIELSDVARTDFLAEFPERDMNTFQLGIAGMLAANGYYEIWTNSLTSPHYQNKFNLTFEGDAVEMLNKLSEEHGILRQTMLFTGLEVCAYNLNRKQRDLKLFEFGKIYYQEGDTYHEEDRLALYLTGLLETENWQRESKPVTYFDLAQQVSHILARSGIDDVEQVPLDDPMFEYGAALLAKGKKFTRLGKVKNAILKEFGIKQELFYAELETALLFQSATPKFVIKDVPKFPEVRRDVSLVLDRRVTFAEIESLVRATEKRLVRSVILFDVYQGDKIPKDKKAYAIGFTLLDEEKTLTDQEIEKTMNRLMAAFEQKLGAIIRK